MSRALRIAVGLIAGSFLALCIICAAMFYSIGGL
jgi:hypothetical protein